MLELTDFILEKAIGEPTAKRVRLYRRLAGIIGHKADAKALLDLANDLETADGKHLELRLRFRNRSRRVHENIVRHLDEETL